MCVLQYWYLLDLEPVFSTLTTKRVVLGYILDNVFETKLLPEL